MKTFAKRQTRSVQRQPASENPARRQGPAAPGAGHARDTAQRERFDAAFGAPVQRQGAEEEELLQGRFATTQRMEEDELQGRFETAQRIEEEEPLQGRFEGAAPQANQTGMPDALKSGVESLSGMDLSDVRVHAGSDQPARIDALAYAQGNDIHLGPGQEQHLPHEAWHVVQQRQGRVQPTMQLAGTSVNDDAGLEAEADVMGAKALNRER